MFEKAISQQSVLPVDFASQEGDVDNAPAALPMKRLIWITISLLVVAFLGWGTFSSESYSGVCVRCLQSVSGLDKRFFGIPYFHREKLSNGRGNLMSPSIFGPDIPSANPDTYQKIFGKPCEHEIIRTGACRRSGGMIACGSYGGSRAYDLRLSLISVLYHVFLKFPDQPLAQQSYALIDQLYPITEPGERINRPMTAFYEVDVLPNEPLSILIRGLTLARSKDEWRKVLDATEKGDGTLAILTDLNSLLGALHDSDPAVGKQALSSLAARNESKAWDAVASVLDDPLLGQAAATSILYSRDYSHFEAALQVVADPVEAGYSTGMRDINLNDFAKGLTDSDLRTLLIRREPIVDQLCLKSIELTDRFAFLEETLAVMNDRPSADAKRTIERLLQGPYPNLFRDKKRRPVKSPWTWLLESRNDVLDSNYKIRRPTDRLLVDAMTLGWSKESGAWEKWRAIYDGWIAEHAAEGFASAFAEAMFAVDPTKTISYLNTRLDHADRSQWDNGPVCVLAGMGTIAAPECLPALKRFIHRTKAHPVYRDWVDYALHRCRQIQNWKLTSSPSERYRIFRPDGTEVK